MQYTTAILALAGLSSAAVLPRQDTSKTFHVTEFSFAGTPHSVEAHYGFNVSDATDGSMSIECSTTTSTSPSITFFNSTPCSDSAWSFSWTDAGNNQSTVTITKAVEGASNYTATKNFCSNDVKLNPGTTPTGEFYYLDIGVTPAFDLRATQ